MTSERRTGSTMDRSPFLRMRTLQEAFDPRSNSLNALRLLLAAMVIFSHSWTIGRFGHEPGTGDQSVGDWAVAGFFALSGFLITRSRLSASGFWDFIWRRFLRIYPAFLVVLIVIAAVLAPLSVLLGWSRTEEPSSAVGFVVKNLGLFITQAGIPGTLNGEVMQGAWDGPLWTLSYEFLCYLAIGLLVTVLGTRPRRLIVALTIAFAVCTAGTWALLSSGNGGNVIRFGAFFAAGALCYLLQDRIRLSPLIAALVAVLLVAIALAGLFKPLGALPVAYLLLYGGAVLPLQRIGARNDISYGLYIYAWPLQQLLEAASAGRIPSPFLFALISVLLTVPFAWASWRLVERPAVRLKSLAAHRRVDAEGHVLARSE